MGDFVVSCAVRCLKPVQFSMYPRLEGLGFRVSYPNHGEEHGKRNGSWICTEFMRLTGVTDRASRGPRDPPSGYGTF